MRRTGILRVKEGYNPNSSSVGSAIPFYLLTSMSIGAASVLVTNILSSVSRRIQRGKRDTGSQNAKK
jgi:hypothetical protein